MQSFIFEAKYRTSKTTNHERIIVRATNQQSAFRKASARTLTGMLTGWTVERLTYHGTE